MVISLNDPQKKEFVISLFHDYLLREHRPDIIRLCSTESEHVHRSVVVHFNCLCEFDSIFSELLLSHPHDTLHLLDKGLHRALSSTPNYTEKRHEIYTTHVRLTALPVIPEVHKNSIPWSTDAGKFVALRATVSRVGPVQILEGQVVYVCSACGHKIVVSADFDSKFALHVPRVCPTRKDSNCNSSHFRLVPEAGFVAKNYQEVQVHERYRCLEVGIMPRSICICLEDDLVETMKPGDDVVVNGIVTRRWTTPKPNQPCKITLCIRANYVENLSTLKSGAFANRLSSERILEFEAYWSTFDNFRLSLPARNEIIRGICPGVCGMFMIKLSLALMLAGAPEWNAPGLHDGGELKPSRRGTVHLLLMGDPGTAKSVLLRTATDLSQRAVLTTATGSTAAGLTATAIRDAHGWTLEAGALVLADGGLCAIDEFTALHGSHRAAVHEAMEQQTVSIAKAGLVARLNCRCSVLAAANLLCVSSRSSVSKNQAPEIEEFGMASPLLSRFDLIWRLVDPPIEEWDRRIADFVLGISRTRTCTGNTASQWSTERLREYFSWIRQEFKPQLSSAAANLLQRYYVWCRQQLSTVSPYVNSCGKHSDTVTNLHGRSTLRLLESLVRLTKAHARLMGRGAAGIEDAVVVIGLMDASLRSTTFGTRRSLSTSTQTIEAVVTGGFPEDAVLDYNILEDSVYRTLVDVSDIGEHLDLGEAREDDEKEYDYQFEHSSIEGSNDHHFLSGIPLLTSTQTAHSQSSSILGGNRTLIHAFGDLEEEFVVDEVSSNSAFRKTTSGDELANSDTNEAADVRRTHLQQRIHNKLAHYCSSGAASLKRPTMPETTSLMKETPSTSGDRLSPPVKSKSPVHHTFLDFGESLTSLGQLTNKDFEIDL